MKLGLGTVQLGMNYGINNKFGKPSKQEAMEILAYAYKSGIDCFDTAAAYGDSETVIGEYLTQNNSEIRISTKIGPLNASNYQELNQMVFDSIECCLNRLKTKKLDYLMLHNASDLYRNKSDISKVFENVKLSGVAQFTGVSIYSPEDVEQCLKYDAIDVVQVPFNLLDNRLIVQGYFERLKGKGIEIHGRSVYLQGLLLMENLPSHLKNAKHHIDKIRAISKECGLSPIELAFLYVRDNIYIDRFFVGCESKGQLEQAIQLNGLRPLDGKVKENILVTFSNVDEQIINPSLWGKG